jgi:hypothetical protein
MKADCQSRVSFIGYILSLTGTPVLKCKCTFFQFSYRSLRVLEFISRKVAKRSKDAKGCFFASPLARVCPGPIETSEYFGPAAPDLLGPVRYAESIKLILPFNTILKIARRSAFASRPE